MPELREIMEPNEEALMAKPKDAKDLSRVIVKLLNDEELQKKLVKNAREKVNEFDLKKIAEQHIKLYKSLLKK